jgi:hypothetical protein
MNRAYLLIRAVRGPLLLITLGVLLMLQRTTSFHLGLSWPVFIIVLGVLKLAERAVLQGGVGAPAPGASTFPPPPPPNSTPGGPWT